MEISHVIRGRRPSIRIRSLQIRPLPSARCPPSPAAGPPAADRGRMPRARSSSKRRDNVSIQEFQDGGLPTRKHSTNWLVRLGWSHGDDEIFSLDEIARSALQPKRECGAQPRHGPISPKLEWLGQHYIKGNSRATISFTRVRPHLENVKGASGRRRNRRSASSWTCCASEVRTLAEMAEGSPLASCSRDAGFRREGRQETSSAGGAAGSRLRLGKACMQALADWTAELLWRNSSARWPMPKAASNSGNSRNPSGWRSPAEPNSPGIFEVLEVLGRKRRPPYARIQHAAEMAPVLGPAPNPRAAD